MMQTQQALIKIPLLVSIGVTCNCSNCEFMLFSKLFCFCF